VFIKFYNNNKYNILYNHKYIHITLYIVINTDNYFFRNLRSNFDQKFVG